LLFVAACCLLAEEARAAKASAASSGDPCSPWNDSGGWWLNASPWRQVDFVFEGERLRVPVRQAAGFVECETAEGRARVVATEHGRTELERDGLREPIFYACDGHTLMLRWRGDTWRLGIPDPVAAAEEQGEAASRLVAPLPGQVTQVLAEPGQRVAKGEVLLTLEAMKTVFRLSAPAEATIAEITCRAGDTVQDGQVLVTFEAGED
jgi:3-methylcrotonyl-CoA carboxylase alpha subunit